MPKVHDDPFVKVEMTDHEAAKWLKDNGWEGAHHPSGNAVLYTNKFNVDIAIFFYNNQNCTRIIYVHKDYWHGTPGKAIS